MNILTFAAAGIIMCVLVVTVRQVKPEMAVLLEVASGAVLTFWLIDAALPLLDDIRSLSADSGINTELIAVGVKAVGICVAVQIASDVCRDAGQSALAGKLEIGGRIALLIVSMPLFREILSLAVKIIGE